MPATLSIPLKVSEDRKHRALHGQLQHHRDRRLARLAESATSSNDGGAERRRLGQPPIDDSDKPNPSSSTAAATTTATAAGATKTSQASTDRREFHPAGWRHFSYPSSSVNGSDGDDNSSHRRHRLEEQDQQQQRRQQQQQNQKMMTTVGLSNCHLVLYSGEIGIGSFEDGEPVLPQRFQVDFDTGSSDFWVPSTKCDESCSLEHPTWNKYNSTRSRTYQPASTDPTLNAFRLKYEDGEEVSGEHAKDVLWLGIDGRDPQQDMLPVFGQVFAQVTHVQDFTVCEEEEGILGLANSMTSTHRFPTVLRNLMAQNVLANNVFSLYLDSTSDDYEDVQRDERPTMSSQLVLGGVDQKHYVGCLQWHPLLQPVEAQTGSSSGAPSTPLSYWALAMDDIRVGGTSLVKSTPSNNPFFSSETLSSKYMGLLDSGSSYIVGPQESVAHLVELNKAKCFVLEGQNNPKQVDCSNADGFDGAVMNSCEDPFFNLEFIINDKTYVLEKEDLMVTIDTLFGSACILRIVGIQDIQGWVLGDAFLNKYYSVFDFGNQRVGLAPASKQALDVCEADASLDINKYWLNQDPNGETESDGEEDASGTGEDVGVDGQGGGDDDLTADDYIPGDEEDVFDFTDVEVITQPTVEPHHEAPERQPVSRPGQTNVTGTTATIQSSEPTSPSSRNSAEVAIYVVLSAVLVGLLTLIIRRRRRASIKRKQKEFQSMYQDAERAVVDSHKNTNYRDHSRVVYRDEETIEYSNNSEDDGGRDGFVLDSKMLNRMN